jgi:hypothetical protein
VASELASWLSKAQMWPNSDAFLHSFAVADDKEVLLDHLATLRYSLIVRGLGFLPVFEPTGSEGPDLLITRDGISAPSPGIEFACGSPRNGSVCFNPRKPRGDAQKIRTPLGLNQLC